MSRGGQDRLDMENRDPNSLNGHVQVRFEDVIGEPDGVNSPDCVWRNSYACFECGKNLCYMLLTTLCGICVALKWGCDFAGLTFYQVWLITPCMRWFAIEMGCCTKFVKIILDCCCAPFCAACGECLSRIQIKRV